MAKVKVRIAVAVDHTGAWNSCGWRSAGPKDDEELMGIALEPLETGEAQYWLTAELVVAGIYAAGIAGALFVGWQLMRHGEESIRADERAQWARYQCARLSSPRLSEWTLMKSDGTEVFLRCRMPGTL